MDNNLTQQTPYMYGYGMQPQYQRMIPQQQVEAAPMAPSVLPQGNYIKGRPVVSIDEARASQIDLDGSLYVFPDLGNKKIYTKQINMDGTASFNVFEMAPVQVDAAPAQVYVTKDELNEILASFKAELIQEKTPKAGPAPVRAQINQPTFNL